MMNEIIENRFIANLTRNFRRSPIQVNQLHESDAEIIRLNAESLLAITTDTIAEEISVGLYHDPYLIGWMAVMVNMSDLAAVTAEPLGIVVSQVLPPDYPEVSLHRLQEGIQAACDRCGTFLLGGDTNLAQNMTLTGCAIGTVNNGRFLSRCGCEAGDVLYATNLLGGGNMFALEVFAPALIPNYRQTASFAPREYQPVARLAEARCLAEFANACMDTSDGVFATLDQLMRLNKVGFELEESWQTCLHPGATEMAIHYGIPTWLLLGGQHGEFELLFTVPEDREYAFLRSAEELSWTPLRIGRVIHEPSIQVPLYGSLVSLDTGRIRNLGNRFSGEISSYVKQLMNIDSEIQKGASHHVNQ